MSESLLAQTVILLMLVQYVMAFKLPLRRDKMASSFIGFISLFSEVPDVKKNYHQSVHLVTGSAAALRDIRDSKMASADWVERSISFARFQHIKFEHFVNST